MSLRLSDHKVLHNVASSSSFLDFARIFSLISLVFRTSKFLEFKEFNKTIIPFALVRYKTGYSHRAPVAQLVEHRAVMREVVSSTPAGPTLRVFK